MDTRLRELERRAADGDLEAAWELAWRRYGSGELRCGAADDPHAYCEALERARGLAGFGFQDVQAYSCGGASNDVARFLHEATGLLFCLIPGGRYRRGSEDGFSDEQPVREVTIAPFLLCATEVTQATWEQLMGSNPSQFKGAQGPVEWVSWEDARQFCERAGSGLRLPSEAEWENACRSGTSTRYAHGDGEGDLGRYAVYSANSGGQTAEVGSKQPNAFGLFDMHGNVWEWCQDGHADSYQGAPSDGSPHEPAGASQRVFRGGGWNHAAQGCRSAYRRRNEPGRRYYDLGFRPARSLP